MSCILVALPNVRVDFPMEFEELFTVKTQAGVKLIRNGELDEVLGVRVG